MRKYLFTITDSMLKKRSRERTVVESVIGPLQPCDVGKQVFDVNGVQYVEHDEQRDERMKAMGALRKMLRGLPKIIQAQIAKHFGVVVPPAGGVVTLLGQYYTLAPKAKKAEIWAMVQDAAAKQERKKGTGIRAGNPGDYSWVTDDMFDAKLRKIINRNPASALLALGDVYSLVKEEYNDQVLRELEKERQARIDRQVDEED